MMQNVLAITAGGSRAGCPWWGQCSGLSLRGHDDGGLSSGRPDQQLGTWPCSHSPPLRRWEITPATSQTPSVIKAQTVRCRGANDA